MPVKKSSSTSTKKKPVMKVDALNILTEVPYIHNRDELKGYLRPLYIIDDYLRDKQAYKDLLTTMSNILKGCFTIRALREWPIKFKFYVKDKETYTLELRHFFVNLILWESFLEVADLGILNKDFILDCSNNMVNIESYINENIIQVLRECHLKSTKINYAVSETLYNLRRISIDFSVIMGLNFTYNTFMDIYSGNDRMRELMEVEFPPELQPAEVEDRLKQYENEMISILTSDKKNPIGIILSTHTGIKTKQLTEFTIAQGLKPTLSGETIPIPVSNSTILRGPDTPAAYYISAISSRKSLVLNKKVINYTCH